MDSAIENSIPLVSTLISREMRKGNYDAELSASELLDAKEQIKRLRIRLVRDGDINSIICRPEFKGCGIVDKCEGDILIENTLYEIKAGERPFRSIDLRQVLTYLALNRISESVGIDSIGVVNPRVGISFEMSVDEFSFEISGRDAVSLMDSIVYGMSSGDVSR